MRSLLVIPVLIVFLKLQAQSDIFLRIDRSNSKVINIKWYPRVLQSDCSYNIYKKEENSSWVKINKVPVKPGSYTIPEHFYAADKELKGYMALARSASSYTGMALLAILMKSFQSEQFSKFLGITYNDTVEHKLPISYKVTKIADGNETTIGEKHLKKWSTYQLPEPPDSITIQEKNNDVYFKWQPETNRYYGVNIYRCDSNATNYNKLNRDPIIISKTKQPNGVTDYGDVFFVDKKLREGVRYKYYLRCVDFLTTVLLIPLSQKL